MWEILNYVWEIQRTKWNNMNVCRSEAKVFFCWICSNLKHLKEPKRSQCKCLVCSPPQQCSDAVGSVVNAVLGGWMVLRRRVTTPISAQCHSCKQSHGSVLADLTKSALPATKKGLKLFLAGVKASFRLLIGLSSRPGANMLHMAHQPFCCYHPPAASVSKATHS